MSPKRLDFKHFHSPPRGSPAWLAPRTETRKSQFFTVEVAPWHGVKHGKAEVPSFFAGIQQAGPVTEFTPLSFAGNDDGDVMVFLRYAFTAAATGKDVAMNLHHFWRFRDGKVTYYRGSEDTALVASAFTA